eukprot:TRINITY_DN35822_c0_g1_i4.p2 TRINITY_DN35822_c0_g1~~TRINITY_DN35822_c0_g1_i4.p2  ORF type:complete len:231 (-),score=61.42 TRINITY_DN35822_c0_g1_i4:49-741(-)
MSADKAGNSGVPPGFPGGNMPFDLQAMQELFNSDPAFKDMAEKMASDPAIKQMTEQLQSSFAGMMGGMPGTEAPETGGDPSNPMANPAAMNSYAEAIQTMFKNPDFLKMAENLGQTMMEKDPMLKSMMEAAQDPEYKAQIESKMKQMRDDPELKPIIEELETGGPTAMMKYMNDPQIMQKMGAMFGEPLASLQQQGATDGSGVEGQNAEEGLLGAASSGDSEALKKLVAP